MTAQRLNLFLQYVHKSITDSLDIEMVACDFASVNTRRIRGSENHINCIAGIQGL